MNCIVVEDEPAAQTILSRYISLYPELRCRGVFGDAMSAQAFLNNNKTELIFLDINLPEITGVSFLRSLVHPPLVIFTTAYPQYAIDGFDLEIVDFLLKPFSFERFCKAVNKALVKQRNENSKPESGKISVKSDKSIYHFNTNEILFIESVGDYLNIQLENKKHLVYGTLKSWEEKLKDMPFLKIHRSTIINLHHIDHVEGNLIHLRKHKLRISEPYKAVLMNYLMNTK